MPYRNLGIVQRNTKALGVLAVAFGLAIVICHIESGNRRWAAAAWTFALEIPGSPATWGIVILSAGLLILWGRYRDHRRSRMWGLRIGFLWFCALAAAALIAILGDSIRVVNPLSVITWTAFASMYRVAIRDEKYA